MNIYDSFRDSGIDWIGKIPIHWERNRMKFLLSYHSDGIWGDEEKGNANDLPCIRIADFIYDRMTISNVDLTFRNFSDEELEGRQIKKGDLLIEKSGGGESTPVGRVVIANNETAATCSNFIHFIRIKSEYNNTFLCYYFKALYANKVNLLYFNQTTGIQNLQIPKYLGQQIFLPPLNEQEAIADYLDRKCASIDGIIATQERRIALLNELKQSVITEAVTRGINPNAPLRDSGIDWIGQIPEHWEVMRFKNILSLKTTPSISENKIGLENIESGSGKFIEMDNEFDGNGVEFVEGDILYGKLRPYLKKVWLAEFGGNAVGDFFVFHNTKKSDNRYLKYLMLSEPFTSQANGATNGAKMPRVSSNFILTLKVAVPSIEEQTEIVNYIETKISPLDSALAKAKREIELLREYKQSVITEAVTGKIKVC